MTKKQTVAVVANKAQLTQKAAREAVDTFLAEVARALHRREKVVISGFGTFLARKVEDKVSGTGLIQSLNNKYGVNWVEGIPRDRDKISRARSCSPKIANGLVVIPQNAFWLDEYLYEFEKFSPHMTHKHDDQIDPTLDAIHDMLIDIGQNIDYGAIL